jgi:serine/threonine protein kinase
MKFGQYELLERVAVGGMAEVYRGRVAGAEGFEKPVAIKRILPEYARDERFISMMLTEARIHSALSHRNIVQIHDLGISEDGEYFIVLEYVEGHDLRAVMEAATDLGVQIPDSLALHVADELAQALHFAHELTGPDGQPLGIIHRDVSPSNVLITNSGEVKLSDFGIAKRRHDHSFVGSLKGNLVYMSPEQAQRVPLDRRTDVFSLGAVLFEMLTGHKLREITDEVNGFREVASGAVRSARALRPDLPEAYEALLNRALAANPADRFPDAATFGAAIRELRRENDAPVGPADMKELIELLNPPRRARAPVERSKVIRLGPEFKVLSGAPRPRPLTAPPAPAAPLAPAGPPRRPDPAPGVATPVLSPGLLAADMTTPKGNGSGNGNGKRIWTDARLSAATPEPAFSMPPTPPPPVVAPPPFVRTAPPANGAGAADPQATPPPPTPPARGDAATPAAALSTRTRPFGSSILAQVRPAESAASEDPASALLTPPPNPGAFGPQSIPRAPSGPITATGWSAPPPLERSPLTPAAGTLRADVPSGRFVMPAAPPAFAANPLEPRRGRGRSILLFLVLVLAAAGGGAAFVHFKVMPLKVALVWLKPATLAVTSEPAGATVKLDGRELPDRTPLRTEVKRDRVEHTLEFTRAGSLPARATTRFDRTVPLAQSVTLEAEPPPPPPPPEPEPPPEQAVAAEPPPPPPVEAQAETKAETKAAKRAAAKQAKLEAKREAKAAKAAKAAKKNKKAKAGKTKAGKAKASAEPGSEL